MLSMTISAQGVIFHGVREEQVHVGMGCHLGPAVAAHREDSDALGLGGVGQRVQPLAGHAQCGGHEPVGQRGLRADQTARLARAGFERLGEGAVARSLRLRHLAHGDGAGGLGVERTGRVDLGQDAARQRLCVENAGAGQDQPREERILRGAGLRSRRHRSFAARGQSLPPDCCGSGRRPIRVRWCRRCAAGICRSRRRIQSLG